MSFARGRYGVEYTRRRPDEKSGGLRWLLVLVGILLVISFILTRLLSRQKSTRIDSEDRPAAEPAASVQPAPPPAAPAPAPRARATATTTPRQSQSASAPQPMRNEAKYNESHRPEQERVLLRRLEQAEREGNAMVAIDTITRLCDRPAVADLHPRLWKRLGELNMQLLFSERSTHWTARVTVKRGDSRDRIARDNRTTSAALDRLNPNTNWKAIHPGDVIRVLQYPKAVLVIHKGLGFADLSLKGRFFHRYPFSGGAHATPGVYPINYETGKTAHAHLRDLGVNFSQQDRSDIEMFLGPESSITVSDQ